ncbi:MAG: EamA family transporter [Planctomycetota bacterium]
MSTPIASQLFASAPAAVPWGECAAVATALCWAATSLFFGFAARRVGALAVNQFRLLGAVAVLLVAHAVAVGGLWPSGLPAERLGLLAASGVLGLTVGDLGYFHALGALGPRLSSVLQATWPAMALLLALGRELPSALQVGGLLLTMAGVVLVLLRTREGTSWGAALTPRQRRVAIAAALLGAFGQAAGMVLSRAAMQQGPDLPEGVAPLSATLVRMVAGLGGMVVLGALQGRLGAFVRVVRGGALGPTLLGTLFGPVVGVWLSMVAARYADSAGAAAALMATTPLFLLPVARFAYGARVGLLAVFGTLLAVAGSALLLLAGR